MAFPLLILAVPAALFGLFALGDGFNDLLEGALPAELRHGKADIEGVVVAASLVAALAGIGVAAAIYLYRQPAAELVRARLGPLPGIVEQKFYFDFIAETVIVRWILNGVVQRVTALFDTHVVDRTANEIGEGTRRAGDAMRRVESGHVQAYTSLFFIGLVIAIVAVAVVGTDVIDR